MENTFQKTAMKITKRSMLLNFLLFVGKLSVGLLAHSGAMVSDAIHSASDVASTLIVMLGVRASAKESDKEHPYGHERMECVAAILLSVLLALTALGLGYTALMSIISGSYRNLPIPQVPALLAAGLSIGIKEWMYRYTEKAALSISSTALLADAWDNRSDALASLGTLLGVLGARLGFPITDALASLVICLLIAKAAVEIFRDATKKMVDTSCDSALEQELRSCVLNFEQVLGIHLLQTRVFGSRVYVDLEIGLDNNLSLQQAHDIAEQIHTAIEETFPQVKHIMIHTEPENAENI